VPDFLDKAKVLAKDLSGKAKVTVTENSDKIDDGIAKAAVFVDGKTKGKYSDKIDTVQTKARAAVEKIATSDPDGDAPPGDGRSGPPPGRP